MGMTMTQKILAAHAGLDSVSAGQLIKAKLDIVLGNDITTPVAVNEFKKAGFDGVFDKDKIAISFLTDLGLEAEANTLPRQLSGGMKQRVSLARALAFDGDVSLFDEPFNGLDEAIKERAAALLRKKGEDSLVILITHSADDAELCGAEILEFSQLNKA